MFVATRTHSYNLILQLGFEITVAINRVHKHFFQCNRRQSELSRDGRGWGYHSQATERKGAVPDTICLTKQNEKFGPESSSTHRNSQNIPNPKNTNSTIQYQMKFS
jgi:hypothetical protein